MGWGFNPGDLESKTRQDEQVGAGLFILLIVDDVVVYEKNTLHFSHITMFCG
jgi:hypothetical protein